MVSFPHYMSTSFPFRQFHLRQNGLADILAPFQFSLPKGNKGTMANTAGSRKRARQSEKRRQHNASQRSTLRTAIKTVQKAIEAGDKAAAMKTYQESVSTLDRIADKKIIHKNKASRHKSRLAAQIKGMAAAA